MPDITPSKQKMMTESDLESSYETGAHDRTALKLRGLALLTMAFSTVGIIYSDVSGR
jgi:hypothetical protein